MCTQLKIHGILNEVISSIVPEVSLILAQFYFVLDGPGVSFIAGIVCPQASQMCCDSSLRWLPDLHQLNQSRPKITEPLPLSGEDSLSNFVVRTRHLGNVSEVCQIFSTVVEP